MLVCVTVAALSLALQALAVALQYKSRSSYRDTATVPCGHLNMACTVTGNHIAPGMPPTPLETVPPLSHILKSVTVLSMYSVAYTTPQPAQQLIGGWCGVSGSTFLCPEGPLLMVTAFCHTQIWATVLGKQCSAMSLAIASQVNQLGTVVLDTRVARVGLCLMAYRRQSLGAQRCSLQPPAATA